MAVIIMMYSGADGYEVIKYPEGGQIRIHRLVSKDDPDYVSLFLIATQFAKRGSQVMIPPRITRPPKFIYASIYGSLIGTPYEGKCPDMQVDDKWYEYEGFITRNSKRAFSNMLNRGLKQSSRLIIEDPGLTDAYMKRIIHQRIKCGQTIEELWLLNGNGLRLIFKEFGDQS